MSDAVIARYGEARLPRYTSYPTAPKFTEVIGPADYAGWLKGARGGQTSLYLHIPFCRSMCWYCGCPHHDHRARPADRRLSRCADAGDRHGVRADGG